MSAEFPPPRTRTLSRREVVTGLALLGAAGVAAARKPSIPINYLGSRKLEDIVPTKIGPWQFVTNSGLVTAPEDQLQLVVYSQLLTRTYFDGTTPIWLLIAYSADQTGFLQVHRPEFCYTAAGFQLSDQAPHTIRLASGNAITTNSLTAVREDSTEKMIYWTRIGNHVPLSWTEQKLTVARDNLQRLIPDAALVRISTVGLDEASALATMDRFVRSMISSIQPAMQRVFIP